MEDDGYAGSGEAVTFSVIIPSRNVANLAPCVAAIQEYEPGARIIVVDDGVDWPKLGDGITAFTRCAGPEDSGICSGCGADAREGQECTCCVERINGINPFIFSRNCNIGIRAAGGGDVVLLNDDALLLTRGGFSAMAALAAEHPEYGIISAVTNSTGNRNQCPRGTGLRDESRMVCFVCVYIPARTIEAVGLLDERFGGLDPITGEKVYGFDDDDYCLRIRRAGLKIGIFEGCYVDHKSLRSTFRSGGHLPLEPGRRLFVQKWGNHPL
jgi:GT2 family glycosyltransferase